MREDAEKMDENKKKDTLKRMGEMADLNAIRQIKECLLKNEKGDIKGTVQNYMMIFRDDPLIKGCLRYNRLSERVDILILSILVDTFISKISLPMQPVPEIRSISGA